MERSIPTLRLPACFCLVFLCLVLSACLDPIEGQWELRRIADEGFPVYVPATECGKAYRLTMEIRASDGGRLLGELIPEMIPEGGSIPVPLYKSADKVEAIRVKRRKKYTIRIIDPSKEVTLDCAWVRGDLQCKDDDGDEWEFRRIDQSLR